MNKQDALVPMDIMQDMDIIQDAERRANLLKDYQEFCKKNWGPGVGKHPSYFALGLGGEAGEILELYKKAQRDEKPIDKDKLLKECGDVLWYLTNVCTSNGFTLEEVIQTNIGKLTERHGGTYKANMSDSDVVYQLKGPHIEMVERATGKHIKFCKKAEVPEQVLRILKDIYIADPADKMPWEE